MLGRTLQALRSAGPALRAAELATQRQAVAAPAHSASAAAAAAYSAAARRGGSEQPPASSTSPRSSSSQTAGKQQQDERMDFPGGSVPFTRTLSFLGGASAQPQHAPLPCYRTIDAAGRVVEGAEVPHPLPQVLFCF
jgi:hypothetical protein